MDVTRILSVMGLALAACQSLPAADTNTATLEGFMTRRGYERVPLTRGPQNQLLVKGQVNGQSVLFIVDTGAGNTIILWEKAVRLKWLKTEKVPIQSGLGAKLDMPMVVADQLQLGGLVLTNQAALVAHYLPGRQEGILGWDFLVRAHALIDCRAPCIYLRKEAPSEELGTNIDQSFRTSGFAASSLVELLGGKLMIKCQVNSKPAWFLLDTGSFVTLVDREQTGKYGLRKRANLAQAVDVAGERKDMTYTVVGSMRFGDFELERVLVGVTSFKRKDIVEALSGVVGLPSVLGLLGPEVLDKGAALIDCAGRRLYFRPAAK